LEEVSRRFPPGFTDTDVTSPKCELRVLMQSPELMSQNLIVRSFDPEMIKFPNGLKTTLEIEDWCPLNDLTIRPVSTSKNFTFVS